MMGIFFFFLGLNEKIGLSISGTISSMFSDDYISSDYDDDYIRSVFSCFLIDPNGLLGLFRD